MNYLDVRDKMAAAEASPMLEDAVDTQIEHSTIFHVKANKKFLVVVLDEPVCYEAMRFALTAYKEVHLIIARSAVECQDSDPMWRIQKWLDDITCDGAIPFTSIELVGRIQACGCKYADIIRY